MFVYKNSFLQKVIKKIGNWLIFPFKYVRNLCFRNFLLKQLICSVSDINNPVYIFQYQYYDLDGKNCFNGGAERYVKDLAEILSLRGYTPVLIQAASKHNKFWCKKMDKLLVIGIFADFYYKFLNKLPNPVFAIYSGLFYWGKKNFHPNVIISHGVTWDEPMCDINLKKIFNEVLKDADYLVSVDTNTISQFRTFLKKEIKQTGLKFSYIPNYVDTQVFFPIRRNEHRTKILFPRRCSQERGFFLITDILSEILDKYDFVDFTFAGYLHTDKSVMIMEKLKKTYPERINHLCVSPDDMHLLYKNSDISIIPTLYSEGTSLSCLEAMACANCVIATNIGGLPNLIFNNFNGLLINPAKEDLLNALDNIIKDTNLRMTIQYNAVKVAAVFDKKMWIQNWEKLLIELERKL